MEFLPDDLVVDIVVRLHVKEISRLKLVCKSWCTLISSSGSYITRNFLRNSPFPIILRAQGNYHKLSLSLLEFTGIDRKEGVHYTHIPLTPPNFPPVPDSRLHFIGSCDCSFFVLQLKRIADQVINRVYMSNPLVSGGAKLVAHDTIGGERRQYKVGFVPSNATYKLVRFVSDRKKAKKPEILTVGLDESWRAVDDDPFFFRGVSFYERVVCFNGAFHWMSDDDDGTIISTFRLLEEKSGAGIRKPHGVSRFSSDARVTVLKDRLSVSDISGDDMVIWRMREYGVVESWSKVFVLRLFALYDYQRRYCFGLVPIAVLSLSGEDIQMFVDQNDSRSKGRLCFYDRRWRQWKQIDEHPHLVSSFHYRIYFA